MLLLWLLVLFSWVFWWVFPDAMIIARVFNGDWYNALIFTALHSFLSSLLQCLTTFIYMSSNSCRRPQMLLQMYQHCHFLEFNFLVLSQLYFLYFPYLHYFYFPTCITSLTYIYIYILGTGVFSSLGPLCVYVSNKPKRVSCVYYHCLPNQCLSKPITSACLVQPHFAY